MLVGIEEQCDPRQIVIEIENVKVLAADFEQTHADELVGHDRNLLETNNLFVELLAVASRLAAEDDEQRFAAAPRCGPRRLIVGKPPGLLGRLHRWLPIHPAGED
jgi:hypothetical protein